jgi:uncharacterized membrane protein
VPIFSFSKKSKFFTVEQQHRMVAAVQQAEKNTSGEVRIFVESKCGYMDAVDRAKEIFFNLKMEKTKDRNAVLLYMAIGDRQLALFADEGIYQRLGQEYWDIQAKKMINSFTKDDYTGGVCLVVNEIGQALKTEFPYQSTDKNELPDEIVFGK